MSDDLFDNNKPTTQELDEEVKYLDELVGEGKKFSDYEALARGKVKADSFIDQLTSEMDELRQDLKTRLTMEEFMTKLNDTSNMSDPSNPNPNPDGEQGTPENQTFTIDEVEKLLDRKMSEKEQSDLRERNLTNVMSELEKTWGSEYRKELTKKAEELGFKQDWLTNLAEENPKAFLKVVDATKKPEKSEGLFAPPANEVNTTFDTGGGSNPSQRTRSYYVKLRETDPETYYSAANKLEMHRQAQNLGAAFFDTDR
jgi:hypothetical protein